MPGSRSAKKLNKRTRRLSSLNEKDETATANYSGLMPSKYDIVDLDILGVSLKHFVAQARSKDWPSERLKTSGRSTVRVREARSQVGGLIAS